MDVPPGPHAMEALSTSSGRVRKLIEEGALEARRTQALEILPAQDEARLNQFILDLYVPHLSSLVVYLLLTEHTAIKA
jgi:hypothetical protein